MATEILSAKKLRELLSYEPNTGRFTWAVDRGPRARKGQQAGSIYSNGYRMIGIGYRYICAHRLAWLYVHGKLPNGNIDHINGDRSDNRIENLRDVSRKCNSQNQRRPHSDKRSCDMIGATFDKTNGIWKAQLCLAGKTIYLGRFKTAEEAHAAYLAGKRQMHEGCTI